MQPVVFNILIDMLRLGLTTLPRRKWHVGVQMQFLLVIQYLNIAIDQMALPAKLEYTMHVGIYELVIFLH